MQTKRRGYTPYEFFEWSFRHTVFLVCIAILPTVLYHFGWTFLSIPWQPIAVLGTAVAFIIGMKNNSSYGRIWEARQIYGAIVNDSRSFGYTLRDALPNDKETTKKMIYRHFAWLTALRFQLREARSWENMQTRRNLKYLNKTYSVEEWKIVVLR